MTVCKPGLARVQRSATSMGSLYLYRMKQFLGSSWVLLDCWNVEDSLTDSFQRASFISAASLTAATGCWLCPLRSVGWSWMMRPSEWPWIAPGPQPPHPTPMSMWSANRCPRHPQFRLQTDISAPRFKRRGCKDVFSAGVPVAKGPAGLCRTDGKRPNMMTLIHGKLASLLCGTWHVAICTTASCYTGSSVRERGRRCSRNRC